MTPRRWPQTQRPATKTVFFQAVTGAPCPFLRMISGLSASNWPGFTGQAGRSLREDSIAACKGGSIQNTQNTRPDDVPQFVWLVGGLAGWLIGWVGVPLLQ